MSFAQDILIKAGVNKAFRREVFEETKKEPNMKFAAKSRREWSTREVAELERLASEMSVYDVADKMGRTVLSVRRKANSIGIEFGKHKRKKYAKWSDEIIEKVRILRAQNKPKLTTAEIAEITGLASTQVRYLYRHKNIGMRNHKWTLEDEILVAKHYDKVGPGMLSDIMGIPEKSISSRNNRMINSRTKNGRASIELAHDKVVEHLKKLRGEYEQDC